MKLMVCGSRNIIDVEWIFQQINICVSENNFKDIILVEGEARGVDSISALWARRHGCEVLKYPADWALYGRKAGILRNIDMYNASDFVLILWDGKSNGTNHVISLCKKGNKPYKIKIYKNN